MGFPLLTFKNVSIFSKEDFGVSLLNFDIQERKKYHLIIENQDKLNSLLGLLEGRYNNYSGIIRKEKKYLVKSDRLLLGDKIYHKEAERMLAIKDEFFFFDGQKRSKMSFINSLNAKNILSYPVYKLKGDDKHKFSLLSLIFQETGIILISKLNEKRYFDSHPDLTSRLLQKSRCTILLVTTPKNPQTMPIDKFEIPNLIEIDLRK